MTPEQEDALFEFIEQRMEPFSAREAARHVRGKDSFRAARLAAQIEALLKARPLAFPLEDGRYLSRRGLFTGSRFVIRPTRLELLNGILIPGHRCVPFANPLALFKEYRFLWKGKPLPFTTTEAAPEDLYPYFLLFGEEYGPQCLIRDNPENEERYGEVSFEEPDEVSINTLDMRRAYRESGFAPGDCFVATLTDWLKPTFVLERVPKDTWKPEELLAWQEAAEEAFFASFEKAGPCSCAEEQIAFAYFFGGERVREVPAYAPEEFLLEKTCKIEPAPFGMETRFWYAGKEIPDYQALTGIQTQADETPVERILRENGVPVSEFVLHSYLREALHRGEADVSNIIEAIITPASSFKRFDFDYLAAYLLECMDEFRVTYNNAPLEKRLSPMRERACELHTSVLKLAFGLQNGKADKTWLPSHVFVMLSQIQIHTACILEDLNVDEELEEEEVEAIEATLDNMIDAYEDIKESIETAMSGFRQTNLSLLKAGRERDWRAVQIGVGGTDIWRRVIIDAETSLGELRGVIAAVLGWSESRQARFVPPASAGFGGPEAALADDTTLAALSFRGVNEFIYEYRRYWTIKVINLSPSDAGADERPRCAAGEGAAPDERVEGPLSFRRHLAALESPNPKERERARKALGKNYGGDGFSLAECDRRLGALYAGNPER